MYIPPGFNFIIDLKAELGKELKFGLTILYSGSPKYLLAGICIFSNFGKE